MGLTISFENDIISKSIKTGHFLDTLERLEVQMPRTLESQVLLYPQVDKSNLQLPRIGLHVKSAFLET